MITNLNLFLLLKRKRPAGRFQNAYASVPGNDTYSSSSTYDLLHLLIYQKKYYFQDLIYQTVNLGI